MLYYDGIVISKGIDVNKTSESKECNVCRYSLLLKKGLIFKQISAMDANIY